MAAVNLKDLHFWKSRFDISYFHSSAILGGLMIFYFHPSAIHRNLMFPISSAIRGSLMARCSHYFLFLFLQDQDPLHSFLDQRCVVRWFNSWSFPVKGFAVTSSTFLSPLISVIFNVAITNCAALSNSAVQWHRWTPPALNVMLPDTNMRWCVSFQVMSKTEQDLLLAKRLTFHADRRKDLRAA